MRSNTSYFLLLAMFCVLLISCESGEEDVLEQDPSEDLPADDVPGDIVEPPFGGTIFVDPDIIAVSDTSIYDTLVYTGIGTRQMFDRRLNAFENFQAYLFDVTFLDGSVVELQANPEFGDPTNVADLIAPYLHAIGQLPSVLRSDLETIWFHDGDELFGGGNRNILIHLLQGEKYISDGILEETLVHEASHTSLDGQHAASAGWLAAQENDPTFISNYARDFPGREDIAESFVLYLAVRYRENRISEGTLTSIAQAIPNRIQYFDDQNFDLAPFE